MKLKKFVLGVVALTLASGIGVQAHAAPQSTGLLAMRPKCTTIQTRDITTGGRVLIPASPTTGDDCWLDYDINNNSYPTYWLQYALRHAEAQRGVDPDGYYGSVTKNAVRRVQTKRYVHADGVYGPVTGRAMYWKEGKLGMIGKWR